jgi:hypothetical protein
MSGKAGVGRAGVVEHREQREDAKGVVDVVLVSHTTPVRVAGNDSGQLLHGVSRIRLVS